MLELPKYKIGDIILRTFNKYDYSDYYVWTIIRRIKEIHTDYYITDVLNKQRPVMTKLYFDRANTSYRLMLKAEQVIYL